MNAAMPDRIANALTRTSDTGVNTADGRRGLAVQLKRRGRDMAVPHDFAHPPSDRAVVGPEGLTVQWRRVGADRQAT